MSPLEYERTQALCDAMEAFAARVEQDRDLFVSEGDRRDLMAELKRQAGLMRVRKANPAPPSPERRIQTLVHGLECIARELGSLRAPADTVAAYVAKHAVEEDARDYWATNDGPLWGYVRWHSIVIDQLRERGVLCWTSPDVEPERMIFLVDERRPTASAVDAWLVANRENTRRCKLCDTPIYHHLPATFVDHQRSNGHLARVHVQCEPAWSRVLEIASKYPTVEAAAAADDATGVTSKGLVQYDPDAGNAQESAKTATPPAEPPLEFPGGEGAPYTDPVNVDTAPTTGDATDEGAAPTDGTAGEARARRRRA